MSAITFKQALSAVVGGPANPDAKACIEALAKVDRLPEDLPTLSRLQKGASDEHKGKTQGALVIAILKLRDIRAIYASVCLIAPGVFPDSELGTQAGDRRATRLYGDCYLALGEWATNWNRSQIRRVA